MHVSIRTSPGFEHHRAGATSRDAWLTSALEYVGLDHLNKDVAASNRLPAGLKAEGLKVMISGTVRGARVLLRGPNTLVHTLSYGHPCEDLPSRWAFSIGTDTVPVTREAVETLLASKDPQTRVIAQQLLRWVDEDA